MRQNNRRNNFYFNQTYALFLGALVGWQCAVCMRAMDLNIIEETFISWSLGQIMLVSQGRKNSELLYTVGFVGGSFAGACAFDMANLGT